MRCVVGGGRSTVIAALVVGCGASAEVVDVGAGEGVLLEEFDGSAPNGVWERVQPSPPDFEFVVTADELAMIDQGGANQHLVRRNIAIDPGSAYAIEVELAIAAPLGGLDSFAINFQQGGRGGDLGPIDCWAINLDLEGPEPGGVMKSMGFVDGVFQQIGQHTIAWGEAEVWYALRVEVHRDLAGAHVEDTIAVEVREGEVLLERFEQDYRAFPYQPPAGEPVRFGLNTHGATWRARNLRVAYL